MSAVPRSRSVHWLDHAAAIQTRRRRLFAGGWGDEGVLERVPAVARFAEPARAAAVTWGRARREGPVEVTDGWFASACPGLPPCASTAFVRRIAPAAPERGRRRPVYVALAASGEEGFASRTRLWRPLAAREGIEVILLENAMYGLRRPEGQRATAIRTVAEHLLMNLATVEETRALVEHLAGEGYERIGVVGFSMGGTAAALAAAATARPLAVAIIGAGRSVVPVFTEGMLSISVEFEALGGAAARARLGALFGAADLDRHPTPRRPDAAVIVGARRDGYVFAEQVEELHALWRASELRWLDTGHAGAVVYKREALRRAAVDAMARLGTDTTQVGRKPAQVGSCPAQVDAPRPGLGG
ncbi:alpha/beta hydrolase family protein [Sorangium sp. So ce1335]|uniref:alpha/beta hydrolase family protein n=1 Tax=Sorangium sp. So ce1335 TaxID=3133335 RepID=UPI003F5F9AF1